MLPPTHFVSPLPHPTWPLPALTPSDGESEMIPAVPALVETSDDESDSSSSPASSPSSSLGSIKDFVAIGVRPEACVPLQHAKPAHTPTADPGESGPSVMQSYAPPPRVTRFWFNKASLLAWFSPQQTHIYDSHPQLDATSDGSTTDSPLVECWDWNAITGPTPLKQEEPAASTGSPLTSSGPMVTLTSPVDDLPVADTQVPTEPTDQILYRPSGRHVPSERLVHEQKRQMVEETQSTSQLSLAMRRAVQRRLNLSAEQSQPLPSKRQAPLSTPRIIVTPPEGQAGPPIGLGLDMVGSSLEMVMQPDPVSTPATAPTPVPEYVSTPRSIQGAATDLPIPTVMVTPPSQPGAEADDPCSLPSCTSSDATGQMRKPDPFAGETFEDEGPVDLDMPPFSANETSTMHQESFTSSHLQTEGDILVPSPQASQDDHEGLLAHRDLEDHGRNAGPYKPDYASPPASPIWAGYIPESVSDCDTEEESLQFVPSSPDLPPMARGRRTRTASKRLAGRKMVQRLGWRAGVAC